MIELGPASDPGDTGADPRGGVADARDDRKDWDGLWGVAFDLVDPLLWVARGIWALIGWMASLVGE